METFHGRHKLPKFAQEDKDNMNTLILLKTLNSVKNPPIRKSIGPEGFHGECHQTFKEEIPILHKLLHKIRKGRNNKQLIFMSPASPGYQT